MEMVLTMALEIQNTLRTELLYNYLCIKHKHIYTLYRIKNDLTEYFKRF
jgi:hypothetical protein